MERRATAATHALTLGFLLAVVVLSGCTEKPIASPTAAVDTAPTWQTGHYWHFSNGSGNWQNWTVENLEERNGRPAYRVGIEYSEPEPYLGYTRSTAWIDRASLGGLEGREQDGAGAKFTPATAQFFPMVNRSYQVHMSFHPQGTAFDVMVHYRVIGWEQVTTPTGTWPAMKVTNLDEGLDDEPKPSWFSPGAGNIVQFVDEDSTYKLMATNWKGSG